MTSISWKKSFFDALVLITEGNTSDAVSEAEAAADTGGEP